MAIETNELIDVKTLSPFKRFIMTIGNLPTSYLESMTYGEMLMWFCNYLQETVIPTVNNNAEAVEELQDLYIELKNYVDDYFENLDVQTEINNKLDEMALNGTLTNLIKDYVDPIYEAYETSINDNLADYKTNINTQINIMNNKIDNTTSGSPLVASSTADMTDTTRVYVNTTDGKWYYYDGTNWTIGGTYQSTEIESNSIGYNEVETSIKKQLSLYITKDTEIWEKGYYGTNGTYNTSDYYYTTKPIKVFANEYIRTNVNINGGISVVAIVETTEDGTYVSTIATGDYVSNYPTKFYCPSADTYYRFTYRIANFTDINLFIDIINNAKVRYEELDDSVRSLLQPSFNQLSPIWVNGFYATDGTPSSNMGYTMSIPIKVRKGQQIQSNINAPYTVSIVAKVTQNGSFISSLKAGTGNTVSPFTYNVTEDCYVIFSYRNVDINSFYINIVNTTTSESISGCAFGDSLWSNSNGNFNYTNTPYHTSTDPCIGYDDWLAKDNINVTNYGLSGSTIVDAWTNTNYTYCIQNFNASMLNNFDFVILSFGRNDSRTAIPLGTLGQQGDSFDGFNTNTIYGAYRKCIEYLWSLKPELKIILWTMTQTDANSWGPNNTNSAGLTQRDYVDAIINLGKLYGIPVVNLYDHSGLNIKTLPSWTFEGVHLTNEGYEFTAPYYVNETKKNLLI